MLSAEARVATGRPGRYLVQLCRHGAQMGHRPRHRPRGHGDGQALAEVRHVEWSDTHGAIDFGWGRCTLRTTGEGLVLRAEAVDEVGLQLIQNGIARRLETIGRRDGLKVRWNPLDAQTAPPGDATRTAPAREGGPSTRRGRGRPVALTALVALAVAVHLGLGGALWARWRWTGPAVDAVLVLAVVKTLVVGRFAVRRARAPKAHRWPAA